MTTLNVKTLLENVRDVYESVAQTSSMMNVAFWDLKSLTYTRSYNADGNHHYKKREYEEAVLLYTKSLLSCWPNIEELPLAYTNRSIALFKLGDYVSCLLDINRALQCEYSTPALKAKLHDRKQTCLLEMKKRGVFSEMLVDRTDPPMSSADEARHWYSKFILDNRTLSNVSRKIQLKYNGALGRHFEAVENIEPGEILSVQELFLFHVFSPKGRYLKNCSFCLKSCKALIPCKTCPMALYCSNKCLTEAYVLYHELECRLYFYYPDRLVAMELDDRMAMQALLIGTQQGAKLEKLMKALPIEDIFGSTAPSSAADDLSVGSDFKNDYISLLNLSSTFDLTHMNRCVEKSVETVMMLKKVSYFDKVGRNRRHKASSRSFGAESYAVALLLNHYNLLKTRAIGFFETVEEDGKPPRNAEWGGGLTLLNSLVNHSCYPNTEYFRRERYHTLFSLRPIKKGEHILVSFNAKFDQDSKFKRNVMMRQFASVPCKCEACVNNWPTIDGGLLTHRVEINMLRMTKKFCSPETYRLGGGKNQCEPEAIIRMVARVSEQLHRIMEPPSLLIILIQNLMGEVMKMLYVDDVGGKARNENMRTMFDEIIQNLRAQMRLNKINYAVVHAAEKIRDMNRCIFREFAKWDRFSK